QNHVRALEHVIRHRGAVLTYEGQKLVECLPKARLVVGLAGRDGRVVELVELGDLVLADLVLTLVGDPDDHWAAPPSGAEAAPPPVPSSPAAGELPLPSSAFILASSESTALVLESCLS